jgi:hypothetical protein
MAELTAELFRGYFGGSWLGKITKNGEFQREVLFNWPVAFEVNSAIGPEEGLKTPPGSGFHDDTKKVYIAGWRKDVRRWCMTWFNEFGGYGKTQFTSQARIDGKTLIYGFCTECKQESDDPTNHIVLCEIQDEDNFKYTIKSFNKGLVEIEARRIRAAKKLKSLMQQQDNAIELFTDSRKWTRQMTSI